MASNISSFHKQRRNISSNWTKIIAPFIRSGYFKIKNKFAYSKSDLTRITPPLLKFELCDHEEMIKSSLQIEGIIEKGGRGAFAQSYVVVKKSLDGMDEEKYVLKVHSSLTISKITRDRWHERAQREIDLLELCSHPNIVKMYDSVFLDGPTPGIKCHVAIMMERLDCTLGDLLRKDVKGYPIEASIRLAKQISTAVEWMHCKGVSHHDLTPDNIMVVKRPGKEIIEDNLMSVEYKVIDLGFARRYEDVHDLESTCRYGTKKYCSPEKATFKLFNPFLADAFALGVILLESLIGSELLGNYFKNKKPYTDGWTEYCEIRLETYAKYKWYLKAIKKLINKYENERFRVNEFLDLLYSH